MSALVSRPTENRAIAHVPPLDLWPPAWLADREGEARQAGDMYLAHLLRFRTVRSLANGKVGER